MDLAQLINEAYEKEEDKFPQKPRQYIGASIVGNPCDAYLAFVLRGFPDAKIGYRLRRIFRDGHRIEEDVIKDLKKTNVKVMENDPYTNKQWAYTLYGGHCVGHADGIVENKADESSMLLEIKSMNDNKFKEFSTKGVKYSHRNYYSQVQFMMGMSKMVECLFIAYNKNTSEYHSELVKYDEFHYYGLLARIELVLQGDARKISDKPSDWRCRGCFKREVCWEEREPEQTMKTCMNNTPTKDGKWVCQKGCHEACLEWKQYRPMPKT